MMFTTIARPLPCDYDDAAPRAPVVGAAPFKVDIGWLDARDEVRAYANRIRAAWREFYDTDYAPWLADRMSGKAGAPVKVSLVGPTPPGVPTFNDPIVVGDVVGGTPAERDLIARVEGDRAAFLTYAAQIEKFDPVAGPSPSQAWQALIVHENTLKTDRAKFTPATGRALKSADPGHLEDQGGVKRESEIPWTAILAVGGLVAGAVVISSVARVVRG